MDKRRQLVLTYGSQLTALGTEYERTLELFNYAVDFDLIDIYIYEMNLITSKMNFIILKAKQEYILITEEEKEIESDKENQFLLRVV